MISLAQYENLAVAINQGPDHLPADAVVRILDVSRFYCSRHENDGSISQWFELTKPVGGKPAGTVIQLQQLYALLFPRVN